MEKKNEVWLTIYIHQEDQASDLQQKQLLNNIPLKLTHEEICQIAQPENRYTSTCIRKIHKSKWSKIIEKKNEVKQVY